MVTYRDLLKGLSQLDLGSGKPVIAHASLSAFGEIHGGAETLLGALQGVSSGVMMPVFTSRSMLIPRDGPADNALVYGSGYVENCMAEFFSPNMPADQIMGVTAETLRCQPAARRSSHPLLSFTGIHVDTALQSQTLQEPLAPIRVLAEQEGWVLLLGVDQSVNTSIHYAEKIAGRKQFLRWALTPHQVAACPGYPGCSDGFQQAEAQLAAIVRQVQIGPARVQAFALQTMLEILSILIHYQPLVLLCSRPQCARCDAVRKSMGV